MPPPTRSSAELARRLKRVLSDEQNEAARRGQAHTRRAGGRDGPASARAHARRYAEAAADDLAGAGAAGAAVLRGCAPKVATNVDDVAERARGRAGPPAPGRGSRRLLDAGGDEAEVGERIRACYREWKTQRIADTARHFVLAAFTRGVFDAAPRAQRVPLDRRRRRDALSRRGGQRARRVT